MMYKTLPGLFILFEWESIRTVCLCSTVQRVHRPDEKDDDMEDRPFTLDNGEEVSDDDQFDSNDQGSARDQHIHENFKVDNERGKASICKIWSLDSIGFRNETNQMGNGSWTDLCSSNSSLRSAYEEDRQTQSEINSSRKTSTVEWQQCAEKEKETCSF